MPYLELLAGARTQSETADLDLMLSGYQAIPSNEDFTRRAYYLMKTALEDGLTLATQNRNHFHRIGDLKLEVPSY